ncbi:hypothetical protein CTI14_59645 [Methylobacterium radiotolerans]|nr:hypothetical protein CTI14_59645 [Methylobacterium radiotolerans]
MAPGRVEERLGADGDGVLGEGRGLCVTGHLDVLEPVSGRADGVLADPIGRDAEAFERELQPGCS